MSKMRKRKLSGNNRNDYQRKGFFCGERMLWCTASWSNWDFMRRVRKG